MLNICKKAILGISVIGGFFLANNNVALSNAKPSVQQLEQKALDSTRVVTTHDTNYIENNEGYNAMGLMTQYKDDTYRIIVELCGDEKVDNDTYYHELGHVIDYQNDISEMVTKEMQLNEGFQLFDDFTYEYTKDNKVEYWACAYAQVRINPHRVKKVAPLTFDMINQIMDIDDYMLKGSEYDLIKL